MDVITPEISSKPWAAAIINDPNWVLTKTDARQYKPTGEDSFFAETLRTDRTVRSWLAYRPIKEVEGSVPYRELKIILDLGTGLNGHPSVAHGGVAAALLDETCGAIVTLIRERRREQLGDLGHTVDAWHYFTAYLNVTYRKPVPTPGPLLCTAKIEREEGNGRKLFIQTTLGDGNGTIFTSAEALFVKATAML